MQFENVIGQSATKKHLIDLVQHNRLSHALLFLGKEGSCSLAMALAFSQYIVCNSAKNDKPKLAGLFEEEKIITPKVLEPLDSCGHCPSCIKAEQFIHPDIHFSFPVIPKKAGSPPPVSNDYMNEWRKFITSVPEILLI